MHLLDKDSIYALHSSHFKLGGGTLLKNVKKFGHLKKNSYLCNTNNKSRILT